MLVASAVHQRSDLQGGASPQLLCRRSTSWRSCRQRRLARALAPTKSQCAAWPVTATPAPVHAKSCSCCRPARGEAGALCKGGCLSSAGPHTGSAYYLPAICSQPHGGSREWIFIAARPSFPHTAGGARERGREESGERRAHAFPKGHSSSLRFTFMHC